MDAFRHDAAAQVDNFVADNIVDMNHKKYFDILHVAAAAADPYYNFADNDHKAKEWDIPDIEPSVVEVDNRQKKIDNLHCLVALADKLKLIAVLNHFHITKIINSRKYLLDGFCFGGRVTNGEILTSSGEGSRVKPLPCASPGK